jgi:hypothetical protein
MGLVYGVLGASMVTGPSTAMVGLLSATVGAAPIIQTCIHPVP